MSSKFYGIHEIGGVEFSLHHAGQWPKGSCPCFVACIHEADLRNIHWGRFPTVTDLIVDGLPVIFRIEKDGGGFASCWDVSEFKKWNAEFFWGEAHPNGAKLKEIRENSGYLRKFYAEDVEKVRGGGGLVLSFEWNRAKGSHQSLLHTADGVIVYVASSTRTADPALAAGKPMFCTVQRVAVNHEPVRGRRGFKLVVVLVVHEHLDPDAEIKRLEAEIARGNP